MQRFAERFAPAAIFARAALPAALAKHREGGGQWPEGSLRPLPRSLTLLPLPGVWLTRDARPAPGSVHLRRTYPDLPAFCCLTNLECDQANALTDIQVRGNLTRYLELKQRGKMG